MVPVCLGLDYVIVAYPHRFHSNQLIFAEIPVTCKSLQKSPRYLYRSMDHHQRISNTIYQLYKEYYMQKQRSPLLYEVVVENTSGLIASMKFWTL